MEQSGSDFARYQEILATRGIELGLIGPREKDRLAERHILNCAVVARDGELVPRDSSVIDVGSGAGLPGLVWAIQRPDLKVTLVDSLLRRSEFLTETVGELGLNQRVSVIRARAEDLTDVTADVVTARAVAPLPRLLGWLRPLMRATGQLVLLKGAKAADEIKAAKPVAQKLGLQPAELLTIAGQGLATPTTVVRYRASNGARLTR